MVDLSRQDEYVLLQYIYYKKEPWLSRQLNTIAIYKSKRKRNNIKFSGKGCLYSIQIGYILVNQRYKDGLWH